ncbi:MAG: hypothetical protein J5706_03180 [Elusimicrobiales bacterium]|nr:hypothetical protein [Elusimicrobiales bacterium]
MAFIKCFFSLLTLNVLCSAAFAAPSEQYYNIPQASDSIDVSKGYKKSDKKKDWLVMIYMAGANNLGNISLLNINQIEGGLFKSGNQNSGVQFVIGYSSMLADSIAGKLDMPDGFKMILAKPDEKDVKIDERNEISDSVIRSKNIGEMPGADSGNVLTLKNFVIKAMSMFPAKKTLLIIWNHGGGVGGIASDDVHGSIMSIDKLGRTLSEIVERTKKKIDVLAMDACLMQMAAVNYEFKDYAKVIVASEQMIPGRGFPYYKIAENMSSTNYAVSDLAKMLVSVYEEEYKNYVIPPDNKGRDNDFPTTLSAINTQYLPGFVSALNKWSDLLIKDREFHKNIANSYVTQSVTYTKGYYKSVDLVDLVYAVSSLKNVSPEIQQAGEDLVRYINSGMVIQSYSRKLEKDRLFRHNGLAIYFPKPDWHKYEPQKYEVLKFAEDSSWDDFIRPLFDFNLKKKISAKRQ